MLMGSKLEIWGRFFEGDDGPPLGTAWEDGGVAGSGGKEGGRWSL
jgi:hypothetical protein